VRLPSRGRIAAGFTFIELLVVIAIIALLASIVVVNMDSMSAPTQLDGAGRALGNVLVSLKDTAEMKNRLLSLEIDIEKNRWRIVDSPTPAQMPDQRDRAEATYYGDWTYAPRGVRIHDIAFSSTDVERGGTFTVTFNGDGELQPSGFVAFLTHDDLREDEGISVELSGLTGLVDYHHGKFTSEEVRKPDDF
jgi:type II secretion system protein H